MEEIHPSKSPSHPNRWFAIFYILAVVLQAADLAASEAIDWYGRRNLFFWMLVGVPYLLAFVMILSRRRIYTLPAATIAQAIVWLFMIYCLSVIGRQYAIELFLGTSTNYAALYWLSTTLFMFFAYGVGCFICIGAILAVAWVLRKVCKVRAN